MPLYETTFVARQDLSKQDVQKLIDSFSAIVESQDGKVVRNEYWGLRTLAYKINKNRKAHYAMLAIDAPPKAITEMERNMRINEEIIRMLTVRVEDLGSEPSVMMSSRSGRDDGYAAEGDAEIPVAIVPTTETDAA